MKQDMNDTFRIALRAMVMAAMTLLAGSTATAEDTSTGPTIRGNVYGGGNLADVGGTVVVNMSAGTVDKDVYGGGAKANTNISNATNYGQTTESITSTTTYTTTVRLTGGTINGAAYGGGLGETNSPAYVYGDVLVDLNGTTTMSNGKPTTNGTRMTNTKGCIVNRVFGCNNVNGTPKGDVMVHVFATQNAGKDAINGVVAKESEEETDKEYLQRLINIAKPGETVVDGVNATVITDAQTTCNNTSATDEEITAAITAVTAELGNMYDVYAVYGGGNNAAYVPVTPNTATGDTPNGSRAQVVIEGCDYTSIQYVYGGGNAAPVPDTYVTVKGTKIIDYVFGGGNGTMSAADVGYDGSGNNQGNGNANTTLIAGTIHNVYGASNTNGDIRGKANIIKTDKVNTDTGCCDNLVVNKMYAAGKDADISGGSKTILGCMPEDKIDEYYGGAENANVLGDVELTITSGKFGKVFGGNKTSGAILGHIVVNIEETGCRPIEIDELYGCGNNAPYSVYGFYDTGNTNPNNGKKIFAVRESSTDTHKPVNTSGAAIEITDFSVYDPPVVNIISATSINKVFGGGYGSGATVYGNPTVNINMIKGTATGSLTTLGNIGDVFGGGNAAEVVGNTTVNIGTETKVEMTSLPKVAAVEGDPEYNSQAAEQVKVYQKKDVLGANITGNVYGGGNLADVTGITQVNICAKEVTSGTTTSWQSVILGTAGVAIAGNVYGGGKGVASESGDRAFYCEEAMVGIDGTNSADNNNSSTYADYGTHVRIGNGTIGNGTTGGNVYGGGEIGRVEFHTEVVIGLGAGTGAAAKSPVINGSVFGAGKGTNTHGYSGLVRGDSRVTIQGDAKVGHSVYGGGEMASVGKYEVVDGLPKNPLWGGKCTVTIQGYAEIGPDNMQMTKEGGPDDTGHVFGAGKGTLPYENVTGTPWSMQTGGKVTYDESYTPGTDGLGYEAAYYKFIQSLGLASNSDVTIGGNAFVKGSVYGGSENGYLQANTHVTIAGGQVGAGYDKEQNKSLPKYEVTAFIDPSNSETPVTESNALATCATWTYDKVTTGKPYDKYAGTAGYDAKGGATTATDGHTYYGNVFGGGRGVVPFAAGKWHRAAGSVAGNTQVDITAGHILSSVYGGNENTDVGSYALGSDGEPTTTLSSGGTCTINITGGTVGVPRTKEQIEDNPVIGNVFGAGKGDKRVLFNTWTNVGATSVNISGDAIIYGSVFGGGEDGHVINNAVTNIGGTVTTGVVGNTSEHAYSKVVIGSTGISGADGNVFGGGRGSVTALTAGVVGGNVNLTIDNGNILGSVYGGGRLASVGTNFVDTTIPDPDNEGQEIENPDYGKLQDDDPTKHGNITININGDTGTIIGISNSTADSNGNVLSGNVFGGSKGTTSDFQLGIVRSTTINMTGGTAYASVYGGGELAQVVGSHTTSDQTLGTEINISGGTIGINGKGGATWGNVFGGGKGNTTQLEAGLVKTNTKVAVSETDATNHPTLIYHNIYGGGAYGSVGTYTYNKDNDGNLTEISGYTSDGKAEIYVTGGTIGTTGSENGMIFGSSRGDVGAPNSIHDKLAWVYDTHVAVGDTATNATITTAAPLIKGSVYGGGENGHNYRNAYVRINGGTIGIASGEPITDNNGTPDDTTDDITYSGAEYPYRGNVYGGGCGTDKYYENPDEETHDGNGQLYNPKAGIVQGNAIVHISAGNIVHNVYGAGAMGSVGTMTKDNDNLVISSGGKTTIGISGGTIGVDGTAGDGNVFGAARGDETTKQTDVALVKTTDVTISGDATVVWGNVYGGGQIGCVGTFDETAGKYVWSSGGLSKVTVSGGKIGPDNNDNPEIGNVFGAGKGKANTFKCEKAMVRETIVSISDGTVNGNVYGGGEIGRVEENTEVTIGRKSGEAEGAGTGKPIINGSVFGAGKGKETHGYSALVRGNTTVTVEGATGAKVGNSVYGGGEIASVGRYGLDSKKMPEILVDGGFCYVKVLGNVEIGPTNASDDKGNIFGAGKGVNPAYVYKTSDRENNSKRMVTYDQTGRHQTGQGTLWDPYDDPDDPNDDPTHPNFVWEYFPDDTGNVPEETRKTGEAKYAAYLETLALATHPEVTISGNAKVNSSVFGGGELGITKGSVIVNILGGTIVKDVYGGGSLANTNTTSTWAKRDAEGKPLPPDEHGNYTVDEVEIHPTTTVNLLGGSMRDAYGGGLGQLALAAQGTEGQTGYQAAVPAIEAKVNGDVKVNLNGLQAATDINTTILNSLTTGSKLDAVGSGYIVKSSAKGAVVNRVFGCNNLNGTPTKKVQVYVFGTQKSDETQLNAKAARNTDTYDVQAVYGGGNLAPYVPADALLDYEQNKATVDAARPEVYIDGCDLTSIKQVYGGGNAASVPATFVEIRRCYEIDEVFGGGNGYDDYSLDEHGKEVFYKNPGANVGYYTGYFTNYATYSNYETRTSGGGSGTDSDPYLAVVNPIYDGDEIIVVNGVEKNMKEARLAAKNIQYGSGIARLEVKGGTIHTSYGGSNSKGNVRAKLSSAYSAMFDDCEMQVAQSYGGGKNAYSDAETDMVADCAKGVKEMFGGAKDADMNGDINMLITNGSSLERVFGGNNTSGAVNGSITITLKEGGCEPIRIGELYAGGFLAPYSVYGYKKTNGVYDTEEVEYIDTDGTTKTHTQRIPLESGTRLYNDPRINVISATYIGNIFGGGYQAELVGNPHINVNMEPGRILKAYVVDTEANPFVGEHKDANNNVIYVGKEIAENGDGILEIGTIGNIYGGGNMADIVGDTYVEIGTGTEHNDAGELVAITPARNGAKITGNVFGGGKGVADHFECKKAMVGVDNESDDENKRDGGTHVIIGNGTVGTLDSDGKLIDGTGNVYGGGQLGRVERNTMVTIGLGDGTENGEKTPIIYGCVFGAGSGINTHGYAALVRGNSTVIVQGNAWVQKSVYGGGEIATVGKYALNDAGLPTSPVRGGLCTVTVKGWAEVGPDNMQMKKAGGPDDTGYVFGACKGVLPYEGYTDSQKPQHMDGDRQSDGTWTDHPKAYKAFGELTLDNNVLEVDNDYMAFINTLALATTTEVTIGGHAFVKGSVYGGSENGHVQSNTHVTIEGDCQIGNGDGENRRYTPDEWAYDGSSDDKSLKECASWDYGKKIGTDTDGKDIMEYLPYDVLKDSDSDDTPDYASDGHTFYGNVFGGGSGYFPYHRNHPTALAALKAKDAGYADGLWHREAGSVGGSTVVDITGGHILTSVYGGNECTDVAGSCTINMVGGTVGVPRTVEQAKDHPVTCYVFGAGKGDQRINFNSWTNVASTQVNISGNARIYGSTFGGGEDGHVLGNVETNIGGTVEIDLNGDGDKTDDGETFTAQSSLKIGTTGTSGVDGNIFGGGRGFSETALTAGVVCGNVTVNIHNGKMLGSVFGGGRLASVGTHLVSEGGQNYGKLIPDGKNQVIGGDDVDASGVTHGHIAINIDGGIIGATDSNGKVLTSMSSIGDVFGGCKGSGNNKKFGLAKLTEINMTGGTVNGNVFGGGELGYVGEATYDDETKVYTWNEESAGGGRCTVGISGGTVAGNVFGAGKGMDDTFECERAMVRTTSVAVSGGKVGGNVYGGGEVGRVDQNSAVTIGSATGDSAPTITGSVFGAGAGVETHGYSALVRGNTAVIVQGNAKVGNSVYGGGQIAAVGRYGLDSSGMPSTLVSGGECVVTVQGNAVIGTNGIGNVFGAGMGVDESKKTYTYEDNANRPRRMMTYTSGLYTDANKALWEFSDATHTYVWEYFDTKTKYLNFLQTLALATDTRLTINGNASVNGSVYGGSESGFVQRYTDVRILGGKIQTIADASGKITEGNVFGGGKGISDNDVAGRVRSDTKVTVLGGTVYGEVYGGGALGKANTLEATNTASVNLLGGVIEGNAFGGGLGNATTAADVGNTRVNLNGMTDEEINGFSDNDFKTLLNTTLSGLKEYSKKGAVVKGSVFGANNVNGTPKGHVLVHVYATQNKDEATIKDKKVITSDEPTASDFDVTGVFGGGKQADYVPEPTDAMQSTEVIIEGCDLTSIYEVYGGGYGAATPGTNVLVKGTNIINNVFGGGYGAGNHTDTSAADYNPGANVGFRSDGTTAYGSGGKAVVQLMAGTVNHVYGGSNTLGNIRGRSNVTSVVKGTGDVSPGCCDHLTVLDIFGGGKSAEMFGGTEVVLGCMPDDWIGAIYAGAEAADVHNDVSLTLTSGKFERVFGGNKSSGTIDGYIEVNIEENPECSTPIIIGGLYGGGNEAPYTYPLLDKDPNYLSPRVNVRAFTSIGNIYGGGFGATATVTGNPLVNINVVEGGREYAGEDKPLEDGTTVTLHARSKDAKMGVIGNVFGGGNAAKVIGNPRVEVGTAAKQKMLSLQTKDAAGTVHEVEKDVLGADIQGNVYGAGNNAEVTGHTNVVIGKKAE